MNRLVLPALRLFAALVLFAGPGPSLSAQLAEADPIAVPVQAGTEFYVAFPPNEDLRGGSPAHWLGLLATAPTATQVYVDVPTADGRTSRRTYDVFPGKITEIPLTDRTLLQPRVSEQSASSAVHVTSRAPIALYAVNAIYQSYGTWAVPPVDTWGKSAMALTLPNTDGERTSQIMIVAAYDSTSLVIRPSVRTYKQDPGRDITVYLNHGQTFLVQARPGAGADLSGSEIVEASRPIGVIAGHVRSAVGSTQTSAWASHLGAMLLPEIALGSEYCTVPSRSDRSDLYRMVGVVEGTQVTVTHHPPSGPVEVRQITLNRGDVMDVSEINGHPILGPVRWSATGPFELAQLRMSGEYGDPRNAPRMIPVTPTDRFTSLAATVAPESLGGYTIGSHTMSVVVALPLGGTLDAALRAVTLDGVTLDALRGTGEGIQLFGNGRFVSIRLPVASGGHTLRSNPDYPFTATIMGGADAISRSFYGWSVASVAQGALDHDPPFVVPNSIVVGADQIVSATISDDRAPAYFSGLWSIRSLDPVHWELIGGFTPGAPEQTVTLRFRPLADPSGPLDVELVDRDGNRDTVRLHEGICVRTASLAPGLDTLFITVPANELPAARSVPVFGNVCGDPSQIRDASVVGGNGLLYVIVAPSGPIVSIPAYGVDSVRVGTASAIPQGTYTMTLRVDIDNAVQWLPVVLKVDQASGVDVPAGADGVRVTPNPTPGLATLHLPDPLRADATVRVLDPLGREVANLDGAALAGRSTLTLDLDGPSGRYLLVVTEGGVVRRTTVHVVR